MVRSYSDLIVWQKSMDLVKQVYNLTKQFPKDELYGLTNQIRRAVVSVPSNIAEGFGRSGDKSFAQFLNISLGSLYEVQTQLLISKDLNYIDQSDVEPLMTLTDEIGKMLNTLIKKLR